MSGASAYSSEVSKWSSLLATHYLYSLVVVLSQSLLSKWLMTPPVLCLSEVINEPLKESPTLEACRI